MHHHHCQKAITMTTFAKIAEAYKQRTIEEMNRSVKWAEEAGCLKSAARPNPSDGSVFFVRPIRPVAVRYVYKPAPRRLVFF